LTLRRVQWRANRDSIYISLKLSVAIISTQLIRIKAERVSSAVLNVYDFAPNCLGRNRRTIRYQHVASGAPVSIDLLSHAVGWHVIPITIAVVRVCLTYRYYVILLIYAVIKAVVRRRSWRVGILRTEAHVSSTKIAVHHQFSGACRAGEDSASTACKKTAF